MMEITSSLEGGDAEPDVYSGLKSFVSFSSDDAGDMTTVRDTVKLCVGVGLEVGMCKPGDCAVVLAEEVTNENSVPVSLLIVEVEEDEYGTDEDDCVDDISTVTFCMALGSGKLEDGAAMGETVVPRGLDDIGDGRGTE